MESFYKLKKIKKIMRNLQKKRKKERKGKKGRKVKKGMLKKQLKIKLIVKIMMKKIY